MEYVERIYLTKVIVHQCFILHHKYYATATAGTPPY